MARRVERPGPFDSRRLRGLRLGTVLAPYLFFLSSCSDTSTTGLSETLEENLQAAVDEAFAQAHGKGISVSVLVPGKPMWTGVAGVSHGSVPITEKSVFAAGSITKTFTALTLLRLKEEGYLALDDSLHAWFPAYPNVDPDITLRQLLNHTSGLSDFVDPPGWFSWLYSEPNKVWDMEEFFLETIRPPYFEKGTAWSYSTSGYLLLRMIIERATGSTIAAQYRQHVLEPLGLADTYVCPGDLLPTALVHGWFDLNGDNTYDDFHTVPNTAFCTAAGGQVYTTSADLAKLGNALMRERTILEDATYNEMTDFYYPSGHDEPMAYGYGLGLMWFDDSFISGQRAFGHGGNAPGYAAGMLFLPDYGAIVTLMDNTEEGEAMSVLEPVLNVVMDYISNN